VIAWSAGDEAVGRALVIYVCLFWFLSGIVLFIADRLELSRAGEGYRRGAGPEPATARRAHRRGAVNKIACVLDLVLPIRSPISWALHDSAPR
jgi:hypothetical protein